MVNQASWIWGIWSFKEHFPPKRTWSAKINQEIIFHVVVIYSKIENTTETSLHHLTYFCPTSHKWHELNFNYNFNPVRNHRRTSFLCLSFSHEDLYSLYLPQDRRRDFPNGSIWEKESLRNACLLSGLIFERLCFPTVMCSQICLIK